MDRLAGFYFDEYALIYLAQWILTLVALIYFLYMARKMPGVYAASVFFVAMTGLAGAEWVGSTAVWKREFIAYQFRYIFIFLAALSALRTIYNFPRLPNDPFERHKKRELPILSLLYAGAFLLVTVWSLYQCSQLRLGGHPQSDTRMIDGLVLIEISYLVIVQVRRIGHLRRWMIEHPLSSEHQRLLSNRYRSLGTGCFVFLIAVLMVLTDFAILPAWWREFVPTVGVLLFLAFLLTNFLNVTLQRHSFMMRLITPALLTVLVVLGLVSIIGAQAYSNLIQVQPAGLPAQTIYFNLQPSGAYRANTLPAQLEADWGSEIHSLRYDLPFAFPFQHTDWRTLTLAQLGVLAFGEWSEVLYTYNDLPAISVFQDNQPQRVFVRADAGQALITWQNRSNSEEFFQATLYPNGDFSLSYPELAGASLQRIGFQSGSGGTDFAEWDLNREYADFAVPADGLLTDFGILQHQAKHPVILPLVYLVLAVSLVSILGFPLLFRYVLVLPLNDLVAGVRAVEAGEMDAQVHIHAEDEIGLVARSFNRMVNAVLEVEQTLEDKVAARTQELVESERRLGALEERERIGRELHDDLGQIMGYLHMQSEAALTRLEQAELAQTRQILNEIDRVAQEAHDNVRQYILGIRTGKTATRLPDFWSALEGYLASMSARHGLQIALNATPKLRGELQLAPAVETQVLRIIQEGITNIYKHAQADRAELSFDLNGDWLCILLQDNGRGFDVVAISEKGGHFGLQIMKERAEGINGRFEVASAPGDGTQLQIRVPRRLKSPQESDQQSYPWRVLLADDHALFREGLGNMLRPHGIQIVGNAQNGVEVENLALELQPDLILMDIHMPECDGLEATRRIKQHLPQVKIVMLTVAAKKELLLQALKNGASGYLLKNLPAPQFLSLLADVMAGKTIVSPDLATQALTALAQQEPSSLAGASRELDVLTDRQMEVLRCLGAGMSNRQIAAELFISESTVKYHVGQMMTRLGLQTRYELIRYQLDRQD